MRKCPPCTGVDSPALDKDAVFFSWNRAHFGAWVITSSPLILGMCKLATLYLHVSVGDFHAAQPFVRRPER